MISASRRRHHYTYDARNRPTLKNFVDTGTPDVATSYYADGAVQSITQGPVTLSYEYDKLRKLTRERLQHGTIDWLTQHTYNTHGDAAYLTYPDGGSIAFAPNALGQATQAGAFATGATYFPNGALKQFTYAGQDVPMPRRAGCP